MIKKQGYYPLMLRANDALLRRIHPNHRKRSYILEEYNNRLSGFHGEQSLDYHLSFLNEDYFIFRDLRIQDHEGRYFQIDILILTPRFFIIIEVKNHKGTLIFDQISNQLIREFNDEQSAFSDPIIQVRRQRIQLQHFLNKNNIPSAPIETLIAVSNSKSIIKIIPANHPNAKLIARAEAIPFKVEDIEQKHKKEYISIKELKKISRLLLKHDEPYQTNILKQYDINELEILTGVHCPSCNELKMNRKNGVWYCVHCNYHSRKAHISSIIDFALLFDRSISNKECRQFLNLSSTVTTSKLLKSLNVNRTGSFKDSKYDLSKLLNNIEAKLK